MRDNLWADRISKVIADSGLCKKCEHRYEAITQGCECCLDRNFKDPRGEGLTYEKLLEAVKGIKGHSK